MTNLFMDWEFYENGKTIEPISVAIVPEDETAKPLYLISRYATFRAHKTKWLMDNVWPHIEHDVVAKAEHVVGDEEMRHQILMYITSFADPQLWAWYGAYDHVCLAQLWGRMIDMPQEIPWFTNDIKTLQYFAMDKLPGDFELLAPENEGPKQDPSIEHHAFYDAMHDRELFKFYMGILNSNRT